MKNIKVDSYDFTQEGSFPETQWIELVERLSTIFHIDSARQKEIFNNKVMKLTASIPYIAECRNPMRTALSHLSTYLIAATEGGKDIFEHNFTDNDSLFTRLERISHFDGGNSVLIERGMKMLALAMLEDHKSDALEDRRNNKYNPLDMKAWNYKELSKKLRDEINGVNCPALDAVMNINLEIPSYWDS